MPRAVRPYPYLRAAHGGAVEPNLSHSGEIGAQRFSWLKLSATLALVSFCAIVWAVLINAFIQLG